MTKTRHLWLVGVEVLIIQEVTFLNFCFIFFFFKFVFLIGKEGCLYHDYEYVSPTMVYYPGTWCDLSSLFEVFFL